MFVWNGLTPLTVYHLCIIDKHLCMGCTCDIYYCRGNIWVEEQNGTRGKDGVMKFHITVEWHICRTTSIVYLNS